MPIAGGGPGPTQQPGYFSNWVNMFTKNPAEMSPQDQSGLGRQAAFMQFMGGMGSALAPNTPMGNVGQLAAQQGAVQQGGLQRMEWQKEMDSRRAKDKDMWLGVIGALTSSLQKSVPANTLQQKGGAPGTTGTTGTSVNDPLPGNTQNQTPVAPVNPGVNDPYPGTAPQMGAPAIQEQDLGGVGGTDWQSAAKSLMPLLAGMGLGQSSPFV